MSLGRTKILMTADTVGGVWTYAIDLCRALAEHAIDVVLATMGGPFKPNQRRQAESLRNVDLREGAFKLEWMQDPWDDVARAGEWLLEIERATRPDVVHLNGFVHGALPWRAPVLVVGHSCVLSWWEAVKGEPAPAEWRRYALAVHDGLRRAQIVAAPSRAMLDALSRHYGPLPKARVIHNGRDPSAYRAGEKEQFVLSAGRLWDEAKNLSALNHAARDLAWPVFVAGDVLPPDGGEVPRHQHVRVLGQLGEAELAGWMARAAVYCLPARYEPFGLSALEAALSGCALVLGDIPSLREVWGDAATFVPPDDLVALRRALADLARSPAHRQEMASRATARAARFAPVRMGEMYAAFYDELMRRGSSVRGAEALESPGVAAV